jgi:cell division protein FtsL
MSIETLIWLLFFVLLITVCLSSLLIRIQIFELEEKIEDLEDEIRLNKEKK